jgi:hypothetical protein
MKTLTVLLLLGAINGTANACEESMVGKYGARRADGEFADGLWLKRENDRLSTFFNSPGGWHPGDVEVRAVPPDEFARLRKKGGDTHHSVDSP